MFEEGGLLALIKHAWNGGKPLPIYNPAAQVVNHTMVSGAERRTGLLFSRGDESGQRWQRSLLHGLPTPGTRATADAA